MANKTNSTKVVTGVVRLSYANVWEPASINGSNPKYSVSLIIPKSDKKTLDAINAAVDAAIKDGASKFGGKIPNKAALKLPLRDGDTERDDEAYKDSFFVNANSTTAPQIVDRSVQPVLDRAEVYSGCYARVSVNFYAFNSMVTAVLPADSETFRRFVTVSLSAARHLRLTISPLTLMTISSLEFGTVNSYDRDSESDARRLLRRHGRILHCGNRHSRLRACIVHSQKAPETQD